MTQTLGKIIADFETSLAVKMAVGATTGTLQSATDSDGVALPTGKYYLTIDRSNSSKEYISCTLTGTALTSIKTVTRQGTETAGVVREHRVGANVIISDYAHIKRHNDLLDGTTSFDSGTPLGYDGTTSITTANQFSTKKYVDDTAVALTGTQTIAGVKTFSSSPIVPTPTTDFQASTKKYVDDTAFAGAPDASTTVKGIVEEATQAEFDAGTAVGATGARLFINPSTITTPTALINNTLLAGENLTAGQAVFVADGTETGPVLTAGRVYKASADDNTYPANYYRNFIGFVKTTVTSGNAVDIISTGVIKTLSGLTVGKLYYMSDTLGAIATTQGTRNKKIGISLSATSLLILMDSYNS